MSIFNKLKSKKDEAQTDEKFKGGLATGRGAAATAPAGSTLLIKQAWITEKASDLTGLRKYIFVIDKKANKSEIKKAIESAYGVKIESVNIINIKGKTKRLGRSLGKTPAVKKAVITLEEGQKIDIMPA